MPDAQTPVGVLAAMPQELDAVLDDLGPTTTERIAGREFHLGSLDGRPVVAVVAGIGKTAVATSTTLLIHRFGTGSVVLFGAAGRVSETLAVGDVVVATHLVHHDLDASPIFPRYHVPGLGVSRLPTDRPMAVSARRAAEQFIADERGGAGVVATGLILSGDQFIQADQLDDLRARFPDGLAVEMEGAAVAQVCIEASVPFSVVRSISDGGDPGEFARFLERDCGAYARGIIGRLLGARVE
jgi:adenosylhomocysteine nucleosidase